MTTAAAAAGGGASTDVPAVVSPQWLSARLGAPDVKVLDVSWYLPPMGRDRLAEFNAERIPGAQFWDVDGVCDPATDLPHMLPSEAAFAAAADALGVRNGDTVVVYDGMGLFSAPRAWWTWKVFGHGRVAVLEGGLPAWKAAGLATETAAPADGAATAATAAARAASGGSGSASGSGGGYKAALRRDRVRSLADMRALVASGAAAEQIADARPAGRFRGADPEPRAGLRGGHMPGAKSVPFTEVWRRGGVVVGRVGERETWWRALLARLL